MESLLFRHVRVLCLYRLYPSLPRSTRLTSSNRFLLHHIRTRSNPHQDHWFVSVIFETDLYEAHKQFHIVYGLFLVETFQSVVVVQMAWQWMVAGWGRQVALMEPGWAYSSIPITTGIGMPSSAILVELS